MNSRLARTAVVGALFVVIGLVQAGKNMEARREMETVTMEEIDAMMEMEEFVKPITGEDGDLRKRLQVDDQCWHGGQSNQNLSWLGRSWGSCEELDHCVCGLHPRRMAYWCPELCRPSCGGACATPDQCPDGFNIEDNQMVPYSGSPDPDLYPSFCKSIGRV